MRLRRRRSPALRCAPFASEYATATGRVRPPLPPASKKEAASAYFLASTVATTTCAQAAGVRARARARREGVRCTACTACIAYTARSACRRHSERACNACTRSGLASSCV
eukprot:3845004-Prymnesium_polylepis.1